MRIKSVPTDGVPPTRAYPSICDNRGARGTRRRQKYRLRCIFNPTLGSRARACGPRRFDVLTAERYEIRIKIELFITDGSGVDARARSHTRTHVHDIRYKYVCW